MDTPIRPPQGDTGRLVIQTQHLQETGLVQKSYQEQDPGDGAGSVEEQLRLR